MIKDLILNSDIKVINNKSNKGGTLTPDEATLLRECQLSESQIQIACHNIIKDKYGHLKDASVVFQKNDNGRDWDQPRKTDSPKVKAMKIRKIANAVKRQKAEGMQKGWKDITIWIKKKLTQKEYMEDRYLSLYLPFIRKCIFVETKKMMLMK